MIGLALSGGGSRAIAFHLGCLRALNDIGLLDQITVISTISGGSVIGAYYAYTPQKTFDEFDSDVQGFLKTGFQSKIFLELVKPTNLLPCMASFFIARCQELGAILKVSQSIIPRYPTRTDAFNLVLKRELFPGLSMGSNRRNNIDIVIGACELRTGTAFRFGNQKSGAWRHGEIDGNNIDVSFAVTASAAYPLLLPALDRTWLFRRGNQEREYRVILTDGGVYDNLGIQVLEPGRDPNINIHTFPCKYIIACNAGTGQESGDDISVGFIPRIRRTFSVVFQRQQDSKMNYLHYLKKAGFINGFAMPYLGQQDNRLPWRTGHFVSRQEVINYPTDFAPMKNEWIEKLSNRGEQLTRILVSYYLRDLI